MFRCNLAPALLAERQGSFMCHCDNRGMEWTSNKSQHTKLTLEKIFFGHPCQDSNSQPFSHKSGALTNKLSQLPCVRSRMCDYGREKREDREGRMIHEWLGEE